MTLLALVVLVANDHLGKPRWPGPVTGKLSDAAWPMVAVPLVALVLAPLAARASRQVWAATAVAVTAGPLVATNLSATAADVMSRGLSAVIGPSRITPDPTDLWLLPALVVPWLLLLAPPPPVRARRGARAGTVGWLQASVLGLSALATVATSCVTDDRAVVALGTDDTSLLAVTVPWQGRTLAASDDGGRTWRPELEVAWDESSRPIERRVGMLSDRPQRSCIHDVCYRLGPDDPTVERRTGDGPWEIVWEQDPARREVVGRQNDPTRCGLDLVVASLHEVLVVSDPTTATGHRVLVARGIDGLLVGDGAEVWEPVDVLDVPATRTETLAWRVIGDGVGWSAVGALLALLLGSLGWFLEARARRPDLVDLRAGYALFGVALVIAGALNGLELVLSAPGRPLVRIAGILGVAILLAWAQIASGISGSGRALLRLLARSLLLGVALATPTLLWAGGVLRTSTWVLPLAIVLGAGAVAVWRTVPWLILPVPFDGPAAPGDDLGGPPSPPSSGTGHTPSRR